MYLHTTVFLEAWRLRSEQSLADAGVHGERKAGNSSACRLDRWGISVDGDEIFFEFPRQLDTD